MYRHLCLCMGFLVLLLSSGCAFDSTPKRLSAYVTPDPSTKTPPVSKVSLPPGKTSAALVVVNDHAFEKSAPALDPSTLQVLGVHLQSVLQEQLPIQLTTVLYPDDIQPTGSPDPFLRLVKGEEVPYLFLAILSSSEVEVPERFPLQGNQMGGGGRGSVLGYRAENYARLELALLDVHTGQVVANTDGQAWAYLERLAVPLESNVYPVVRLDLTQPPIYPNTEEDAFETLRWVAGKSAINQAVMHFEQLWKQA